MARSQGWPLDTGQQKARPLVLLLLGNESSQQPK